MLQLVPSVSPENAFSIVGNGCHCGADSANTSSERATDQCVVAKQSPTNSPLYLRATRRRGFPLDRSRVLTSLFGAGFPIAAAGGFACIFR